MSPNAHMASRGKRSYVAENLVDCSSTLLPAKRTRLSTDSAQNGTSEARYILRPGIPLAIRVGDFRFQDKLSPPERCPKEASAAARTAAPSRPRLAQGAHKDLEMQDGHYVYELGENISSRCE